MHMRTLTQSPRLEHDTVGLIRMLQVPAAQIQDIRNYIADVAYVSMPATTRQLWWAVSLYLRAKDRLVGGQGVEIINFDFPPFLMKILSFAYLELPSCANRLLPRPILNYVSKRDMEAAAQAKIIEDRDKLKAKIGEDIEKAKAREWEATKKFLHAKIEEAFKEGMGSSTGFPGKHSN